MSSQKRSKEEKRERVRTGTTLSDSPDQLE